MNAFRITTNLAVLFLMIWVAFSPQISYANTPKTILFFLASIWFAIQVGTEATTRFKLEFPGFLFVTTGSAALCLGTLWVLTALSNPGVQVGVYEVLDEKGNPLNLEPDYAFTLGEGSKDGVQARYFINGNRLALIYPEQVVSQSITIKKSLAGERYVGVLSYAGEVVQRIRLGTQIKITSES